MPLLLFNQGGEINKLYALGFKQGDIVFENGGQILFLDVPDGDETVKLLKLFQNVVELALHIHGIVFFIDKKLVCR